MRYKGKVYRPWMEADSLLIQTTFGCTHNRCTFCAMFDDKQFGIRDIEEVYKDIDNARNTFPCVKSFFLIDGNVLALENGHILRILHRVTARFPEVEKIAMYAGYNDIRRKSVAELKRLREAGLTKLYTGLESGDPNILNLIQKGLTREQAIAGATRAREAGMGVLTSFILGLGGREHSREHITATTSLLNILKPEEIAPMVLTIQPGTLLEQQTQCGTFVQATPLQLLEEEKYLLENVNFNTFYWGNYGNNIVSSLGWLPARRKEFVARIKEAIIHHPVIRQETLQTPA